MASRTMSRKERWRGCFVSDMASHPSYTPFALMDVYAAAHGKQLIHPIAAMPTTEQLIVGTRLSVVCSSREASEPKMLSMPSR